MNVKQKLVIKNVSKTFKKANLEVLKNISLEVNNNELVGIVGPSGCGKSTLLDCIAGLVIADSGEILLENKASYMMQDDNLFPWRNILDNVILPLEIEGIKKDAARKEAQKLLHLFGLEKFAAYYPFMLSGGMRQRVSLLRTYLCKKDVMLLDEPFARLDALTRRQMQEWFLTIWQKSKKSVLFVTHDVDEAILLSDRVYVMSKRPGRIVAEIGIDLERPRAVDVLSSKKFVDFKKRLLKVLKN